MKPSKDNNFYNFLRFTSHKVFGVSKPNESEDDVNEAFSNDCYVDMTVVKKKLCEKSLIAILQTIQQEEYQEEETYEQMNIVSNDSPCQDDIYECLDL